MLIITIALEVEAKPLIEALNLKNLPDKKFKIFKNENIFLIITGIGKINSAIATTYIASMFPNKIKAFLNIGIAGHASLHIGQIVFINKIFSLKNQFLSDLIEIDFPSKTLFSVDTPKKDYEDDFVYDMEGVGFLEAALKFTFIDLIYSLKIISDNKFSSLEEISKEKVENLINQNLDEIKEFIKKLLILKAHLKSKEFELPAFFKNLHLTSYEQNELKDLVCKIISLNENISFKNFFDNCSTKKDAFNLLNEFYKKSTLKL